MADPKPGTVGWFDLTVDDADSVRDFYSAVAGWKPSPVSMGDYEDYAMGPPDSDPQGGVCHARGENAGIPPKWIIYITVADLDTSIAECERLGGKIVHGPRDMGPAKMVIIEDPAGAVCALYQPG